MGCCGGGRGGSTVTSSADQPVAVDGLSVITTNAGMTLPALEGQIAAYRAAKAKDPKHRRTINYNGGPMTLNDLKQALNAAV